jgi:uncharacterized membrane protein
MPLLGRCLNNNHMQNITTSAELKEAIQLLEAEQVFNKEELIEQFRITYESFKPVNLLKNTLKEMASSPNLINNVLGAAIGLGTGFLSKKIVVGGSGNIFRKLLGSLVQAGVTSAVTQHPDSIISLGQFIFQQIFRKKEHVSSHEPNE